MPRFVLPTARAGVVLLAWRALRMANSFRIEQNGDTRNDLLTFIPFLLMGDDGTGSDTTAALMRGREFIYLPHLWAAFTGDKDAATFGAWTLTSRPCLAQEFQYRTHVIIALRIPAQVKSLITQKLKLPVLAMSGATGSGSNHEEFVRSFATNLRSSLIVAGAAHFPAEERPKEVAAHLKAFFTT